MGHNFLLRLRPLKYIFVRWNVHLSLVPLLESANFTTDLWAGVPVRQFITAAKYQMRIITHYISDKRI